MEWVAFSSRPLSHVFGVVFGVQLPAAYVIALYFASSSFFSNVAMLLYQQLRSYNIIQNHNLCTGQPIRSNWPNAASLLA